MGGQMDESPSVEAWITIQVLLAVINPVALVIPDRLSPQNITIKYLLEIYHKSNQRENNQKRQKEIDKTVDQSLVTKLFTINIFLVFNIKVFAD